MIFQKCDLKQPLFEPAQMVTLRDIVENILPSLLNSKSPSTCLAFQQVVCPAKKTTGSRVGHGTVDVSEIRHHLGCIKLYK